MAPLCFPDAAGSPRRPEFRDGLCPAGEFAGHRRSPNAPTFRLLLLLMPLGCFEGSAEMPPEISMAVAADDFCRASAPRCHGSAYASRRISRRAIQQARSEARLRCRRDDRLCPRDARTRQHASSSIRSPRRHGEIYPLCLADARTILASRAAYLPEADAQDADGWRLPPKK